MAARSRAKGAEELLGGKFPAYSLPGAQKDQLAQAPGAGTGPRAGNAATQGDAERAEHVDLNRELGRAALFLAGHGSNCGIEAVVKPRLTRRSARGRGSASDNQPAAVPRPPNRAPGQPSHSTARKAPGCEVTVEESPRGRSGNALG